MVKKKKHDTSKIKFKQLQEQKAELGRKKWRERKMMMMMMMMVVMIMMMMKNNNNNNTRQQLYLSVDIFSLETANREY